MNRALVSNSAVVTGGSRGIGLSIVRRLAQEGAAVSFCGRDPEAGAAAEAQLESEGLRVKFTPCDVGVEDEVAYFVDIAQASFGPPGILVNNAGVNANFNAESMTEAEWDRFFAIDLKAAWLLTKHVLPHMKAGPGLGAIINVSSIHGFATLPGFFPYGAAKSALIGLTRNLALDLGPHGITVNCIAPGFIRTRLVQDSIARNDDQAEAEKQMTSGVALGRIGTPDEVAGVAAFLSSTDASYLTGSTVTVDGGLTARRAG